MPDRHEEHYESIPWDSLVTDDARRRRRWVYLGIGLVVAVALGGAIGRALSPDTGREATAGAGLSTSTTDATTTTTAPPIVESTADEQLAVRSHAAWFVSDYFTIDGSDVTRRSVTERLPPGVDVPEPAGNGRSFVESVFTTRVESVGTDRYRVVVVVRSLAAPDGVTYQRQPARAVAVLVELTGDGPAILDLPQPVPLDMAVAEGLAMTEADPPDAVLAAARAEAELWREPSGDPVAGRVGDVWRVVQTVKDGEGLIWPVASWFDDSGAPADPPAG